MEPAERNAISLQVLLDLFEQVRTISIKSSGAGVMTKTYKKHTDASSIFTKYENLKCIIHKYGKAGVAFSGGIDSTLLVFAAGQALGRENVLALHAKSDLSGFSTHAEGLFQQSLSQSATLLIVPLAPLHWADFVANDTKRCYYCKKNTYTEFLRILGEKGVGVLLDGGNKDDLLESRPGTAVLHELQVETPLEQARLHKAEIRFLAHCFDLPNYSMPSNSCLATRLQFMPVVDRKNLEIVRSIEEKLQAEGFSGCRVRPEGQRAIVELRQQDYVRMSYKYKRMRINEICAKAGFDTVLVDIRGRN